MVSCPSYHSRASLVDSRGLGTRTTRSVYRTAVGAAVECSLITQAQTVPKEIVMEIHFTGKRALVTGAGKGNVFPLVL